MHSKRTILGIISVLCVVFAAEQTFAQSALPRRATDVKEDALRGVLEAHLNTEVATAEIGVIKEIAVKPGDKVKRGQKIAQLQDNLQRIQVEEAEIEWQSQGTIDTAHHEYEFNRRKFVAIQDLSKRTRVSPLELKREELEMNISHSKWIAQQEAKEIAYARLVKAMNAIDDRTVSAPHDGIIVEVLHDVGEYVAATQPAIVRMMDTSKLRARFLLSDEMAQKFRERKTANIRLLNGVVVSAEIEFIAPIATENITQMTILIDNSNDDIRSSACDLIRP